MHLPTLEHLKLFTNFSGSIKSTAYVYRPTHADQIAEVFALARQYGFTVGLRGSGRSYGDAALNGGGIILDLRRMNRVLAWNPQTGVIKVEPGFTIQNLWQYTLEDGWWTPVTSGTMFPTMGGVLGMNIHGKNNYVKGTLGEHILEFEALLPNGETVTCAPQQNPDLFYALISSAGTLGVFTSITLQMKKIYSGQVWVDAWAVPNLPTMMNDFEPIKAESDYLVGWVDGTHPQGRGQIHRATYLHEGEDAAPHKTLSLDSQILPDTFFGVLPRSIFHYFMSPFFWNNFTASVMNTGKYYVSRTLEQGKRYQQSLVAFNYLLDYVPSWEKAYGSGGLIQYQSFIPKENASTTFTEILRLCQRRGLPTYLAVFKRHRPDKFLFSHAVDGYSLAMDFKVTAGNRLKLQQLANELNQMVLQAQGRFYFAKDSTLTREVAQKYLGAETLAKYRQLKQRCDPQELLQTELYRRLLTA